MAPADPPERAKSRLVPLGVDREFFAPGDQTEAAGVGTSGGRAGDRGTWDVSRPRRTWGPCSRRWIGSRTWNSGSRGRGGREAELRPCGGPAGPVSWGSCPGTTSPSSSGPGDALALSSHNEGLATVVLAACLGGGTAGGGAPGGRLPGALGEDGGVLSRDNSPASLVEAIGELYRRLLPDPGGARAAETACGPSRRSTVGADRRPGPGGW